jgi:DNA invertase Pin-like site-specific DNA recombinase
MIGANIGYIRVSSSGQNTDRQLDGIELDIKYEEKLSGGTRNRPQLEECIKHIRKGDTLHVHSIDRLARNLRDLQEIVQQLTDKGATVKFHKENLIFSATNNAMDKLLLQVMGAFAEFERTLIKQRQREGMDAAIKAGVKLGRRFTDESKAERAVYLRSQGLSVIHISQELELSRPTVYKLIRNN